MKKETQIKYLTPTDIIEKYPELKFNHNWTTRAIGSLLRCNLLTGYYDRTNRTAFIQDVSVQELIEFLNRKVESRKIKL